MTNGFDQVAAPAQTTKRPLDRVHAEAAAGEIVYASVDSADELAADTKLQDSNGRGDSLLALLPFIRNIDR